MTGINLCLRKPWLQNKGEMQPAHALGERQPSKCLVSIANYSLPVFYTDLLENTRILELHFSVEHKWSLHKRTTKLSS